MKPIWIVDDDASIRWVLEKALARENLATRSFASGREALAAFETETPQVLVSDIRMPGESGLDLLAAVKESIPACRSSSSPRFPTSIRRSPRSRAAPSNTWPSPSTSTRPWR
jgi:CheY-like chemotaxis protein